jgi:hypothetical protein
MLLGVPVFGQERPIFYSSQDSTYSTPKEKMETLVLWAKRGVECKSLLEESQVLVKEFEESKMVSDSIRRELSNKLFEIKNGLDQIEKDHEELGNEYNKMVREFNFYKKQNQACNKRNIVETAAMITLGSALLMMITAVIITSRK